MPRLRLSEEEASIIEAHRKKEGVEVLKNGTRVHVALKEECDTLGIPIEDVNYYWHKSKKFSLNVKNKNDEDFNRFKDSLLSYIENKNIRYPTIVYPKYEESHLLVINPADIHIGKLGIMSETGDPHNVDLIIQRVKEGISGLLSKASGFNIDKILFIIGADILHVDNPRRETTSGTKQDTDIMWFDAFKIAQQLYVEVIEQLLLIAPVHIQYDPSNHDYQSGFMLAQTTEAWFRNSKNITFNTTIAHRKYFNYYRNLIGTTHGDGAKIADLPILMAQEASEYWHESKHRYIYTEHIHHKNAKDFGSVCVESFRSPSGADSWHSRNGYVHAPKAIEGFIHSKENGQICRITHIFQ